MFSGTFGIEAAAPENPPRAPNRPPNNPLKTPPPAPAAEPVVPVPFGDCAASLELCTADNSNGGADGALVAAAAVCDPSDAEVTPDGKGNDDGGFAMPSSSGDAVL